MLANFALASSNHIKTNDLQKIKINQIIDKKFRQTIGYHLQKS